MDIFSGFKRQKGEKHFFTQVKYFASLNFHVAPGFYFMKYFIFCSLCSLSIHN